jgi:coatomer subunit beta
MISIVRVGRSHLVAHPIDEGTVERIISCVRFLSTNNSDGAMVDVFVEESKKALNTLVLNAQVRTL